MPRLEKDLASDFVDRAGNFLPCGRVVGVIHDGCVRPFGAVWRGECTLCDHEARPFARSVDVVFDAGFSGLVGVCAAVASHGAHADAVAEGDVVAEDDWLEEFCHCVLFLVLKAMFAIQAPICGTDKYRPGEWVKLLFFFKVRPWSEHFVKCGI